LNAALILSFRYSSSRQARSASASLDFLDVDQVEVLRGPQGTLFGKNTTAGAIMVTTRKPIVTPGTEVELNDGNIGFVQKASFTGPVWGSGPDGCTSLGPSVTACSSTRAPETTSTIPQRLA
jgi:outer membrane receptor protein involved in Fe transport